MEFLGVGPFELLLILIVALVVVGPERLPVLARQAGKMLVTVRNWVQKSPDAAMILRARQEIESELANIRESLAEVQNARDEVVNAARQVNTLVKDDVIGSTRAALDEVRTGAVARPTKPNGMPVDLDEAASSETLATGTISEPGPAEPTLVAPDGTSLLEVESAPEIGTIAPPRDPTAIEHAIATEPVTDMSALQAQVAALAEQLHELQAQLQERGVLPPRPLVERNGNGAHEQAATPALTLPVLEEHDDVNQPAYSRD